MKNFFPCLHEGNSFTYFIRLLHLFLDRSYKYAKSSLFVFPHNLTIFNVIVWHAFVTLFCVCIHLWLQFLSSMLPNGGLFGLENAWDELQIIPVNHSINQSWLLLFSFQKTSEAQLQSIFLQLWAVVSEQRFVEFMFEVKVFGWSGEIYKWRNYLNL